MSRDLSLRPRPALSALAPLGVAVSIVVALHAASASLGSAVAQAYPTRPITVIVPLAAGGTTDMVARILAEHMRTSLGQPLVIENISGAGGSIGATRAARATPDGYSVVIGNWASHVGSSAIYPVQYDVLNDFEPVALLTTTPLWIVARKNFPAKDLNDLIAWLKTNPGKASAGTVGPGSPSHICSIYFQNSTGTRFRVVPYRGGAPALQELLGGQIDLMCDTIPNSLQLVRTGEIKAYAVMASSRSPVAAQIPTVDELGLTGLHMPFWNALWAPKGTPGEAVRRLSQAVAAALADPATRQRLGEIGQEIPARDQQTPAALRNFHKAEVEKWWPIIKAANIRAE